MTHKYKNHRGLPIANGSIINDLKYINKSEDQLRDLLGDRADEYGVFYSLLKYLVASFDWSDELKARGDL